MHFFIEAFGEDVMSFSSSVLRMLGRAPKMKHLGDVVSGIPVAEAAVPKLDPVGALRQANSGATAAVAAQQNEKTCLS